METFPGDDSQALIASLIRSLRRVVSSCSVHQADIDRD
jgi:hypothetical protein